MRGAPPAPCTPGAHLLLCCLSPDCGHLSRTSASRLLGSNSSSWGMDNKRFPLGQAACTPQSCVFVSCLYRRFCKHSPHCLSRLPIPKCSLSHLKSHITLESLIFKDLFKVLHNQTGICNTYHKSQSSFSSSLAGEENCKLTKLVHNLSHKFSLDLHVPLD